MKVLGMTEAQFRAEMAKTIKVQAVGESDIIVGYYNHLRRRGGDVFVLSPKVRDRQVKGADGKPALPLRTEQIIITAEQQISKTWMRRIDASAPVTAPKHFNEVGRGKKRLDIPGMTSTADGDPGSKNFMNDQAQEEEQPLPVGLVKDAPGGVNESDVVI